MNGSLSAIDASDETEYEPLFKTMQSALATFPDTSRLASCLFKDTAEYISMYNCNDEQLASTEACIKSKTGWVAVISNRKMYSDEGSWHFFEWENKTNAIGTSLGIDNQTFEPLNIVEWYRAQHQLVEEIGCGIPGWYGVNKARAGTPPDELISIQYVVPILVSADASNDCGTFVGACGAGAIIPKSFNTSESYPCGFAVTPIEEGIATFSSASIASTTAVKLSILALFVYFQAFY